MMTRTLIRSMICIGSALVLFGATGSVGAAPVVTTASGSPLAGDQIVVTGSGFGSRERPGPALFDRIDNQPAYTSVTKGARVPVGPGYPWTINTYNYDNNVVFDNSFPRHDGVGFYYRTSQHVGYLQWPEALGRTKAPAGQRRIYVSFWLRPDAPIDGTQHSSKFVRIWDQSDYRGTGVSWTQMHLTAFVTSDQTNKVSWADWNGIAAQWNRMELMIDADRGTIQTWTNGLLRHNMTGFVKDPSYADIGLQVARIGWDAGGVSPLPVDVSFGEIYIDTNPARIEICDQPTWSDCRRKEVQVASSWSSTSITFKLQLGSLSTANPIYVYVVDSFGVASPVGVPISKDDLHPKAPRDLTVQ